MTRRALIVVSLAALVLAACGLVATWSRTYRPTGWGEAEVRELAAAPGGGALAFGMLANWGDPSNTTDAFVVRYDADGNLVWQRTYDYGPNDLVMWAWFDDAGGALFWIRNGDVDRAVRTDAAGDVRWVSPGRVDQAVFVGDDIVVARWSSVERLASDGSAVWSLPLVDRTARRVAVDRDGNVFAAGTRAEVAGDDTAPVDAWLARLDASGALTWEQSDGTPGWSDNIGDVVALADGSAVVTAEVRMTADYTASIARRYDRNGALVWHDEYANQAAFANYPEDMTVDGAGNILVVSASILLSDAPWKAENDERVITSFAADGAVRWRKVTGGFKIFNRGVLEHRVEVDDRYAYVTGYDATDIYERGNGRFVTRIDDGTYYNNYVAPGPGGEVYFATTDGYDVVIERYERP